MRKKENDLLEEETAKNLEESLENHLDEASKKRSISHA